MNKEFTPLHEMVTEERIEEVKDFLQEENVPQEKWAFVTYLMGVQEQHLAENFPDVYENLEEDAGNITTDVQVLAKQMKPMITRGFAQSSATEICGLFPMKSDQGKIAVMRHYYTNDQAKPVKPSVGKIFVLGDASAFTVDGVITNSGGAKGVVRYKEGNTVLVEIISGTFAVGDKVDNADPYSAEETKISEIYSTEIGRYVFADYTKFATILEGENATTNIKEVEFGIELYNVQAESHKLRMRTTRELSARLRDYYGMDGDSLTDEIGVYATKHELNRKVFQLAYETGIEGGLSTWDYNATPDGRWEQEKIKTLMNYLAVKSSEILNANKIEYGNYLVIDPIMHAFFNSYGYMNTSMLPNGQAQPMKNAFVGVLNNFFRVYVNPWMTKRHISIGVKDFSGTPDAETRAGIFFHPYLPLDIVKTIQDASGQPVKFFFSMYGFTKHPFSGDSGGNDFGRAIDVTNLPF